MNVLYDLIDQDFGISGRGRWYHSTEHDSLVYDAEKNTFFWNSKDLKGDATDYLIEVRGMTKQQAKDFLKSSIVSNREVSEDVPQQEAYVKLVNAFWANGSDVRNYWYNRKLTDDTINRRSLGYYDGWFTVPLYRNGNLVNFQLRRDEPAKSIKMWYRVSGWKPVLYNSEILQFVSKVYIVEGLVDCILLNQEGIPSVCSSGGSGYWGMEWLCDFDNVKEIYYIADNDKAGKLASAKVANSLGQSRVKIYNFDGKSDKYDSVDFFRDGGVAKELVELVEKDSKYIFEIGDEYGFSQGYERRNRKRKGYKNFREPA